MADDLHSFITGTLWLKLKDDVRDFRVFNRRDLVCAAYFHIRRLQLIQPGWSCRADLELTAAANQPPPLDPDLTLFNRGKFHALFQLEFHMRPGAPGGFPTTEMNEKMAALRRTVAGAEQLRTANSGRAGRGYLVAVYDAEEEWFYPDQAVWEKQSCFWLPVNCHAFADYAEWHQKWERFARLSSE
jgi:hypothetical protein